MGMPERCHNCQIRGHLARDCTACGRCGSAVHSTADHPAHIPFTAFADRVRQRRRPVVNAGAMDVVHPAPAVASTATSVPQPTNLSGDQVPQETGSTDVHAQVDTTGPVPTDPEGFTIPQEQRKALRNRARQMMKRQGKRLERSIDDMESDLAEIRQSSKHRRRASGSLEGPPDTSSDTEYPPLIARPPAAPPEGQVPHTLAQGPDQDGEGKTAS